MDISDIKKIEFIPSSDTRANIRFIKNEEGKRIAQQLPDSDVQKIQEEKIGMIIDCPGHLMLPDPMVSKTIHDCMIIAGPGRLPADHGIGYIEHTQTAIIEALERSDYQGKIILVTGPGFHTSDLSSLDIQNISDDLKMTKEIFLITNSHMTEIFDAMITDSKRTPKNYPNYPTPKPQKSKAIQRKYTQRKK